MPTQDNQDPLAKLGRIADELDVRSDELAELRIPDTPKWIDRQQILIDSRPFDWASHKYLLDMYRDKSGHISVQKAAQMGLSIWGMTRMLKRSAQLAPFNSGYYLPTEEKANEFSQTRFDIMVDSNPKLARLKAASETWRVKVKRLGSSNIFFTYTEGVVSTESTPLDGLHFDEVRRMSRSRIDLILERISHSQYKYQDYISTAGYPGSDINWYYEQSDQMEWWVMCPSCRHTFLPHHEFPARLEQRGGIWGLACPKCNEHDVDPQGDGSGWHALYAGRENRGYHPTQLISKYISLQQIMKQYHTTDDIAEFWRSKLGIPYLDKNTILVQLEHLNSCIDTDLKWWSDHPFNKYGIRKGADEIITVMGIDQQAGYNIHTIKAVQPSGITPLIHLEIHYDDDPFKRSGELMREYDVDLCVCDRAPNFNDATRFAKDFTGRVWLATYKALGGGEVCSWSDKTKASERPTQKEMRAAPEVSVNRVAGMEWSLLRFASRENRIPHPDALVQGIKARDLIDPMLYEQGGRTLIEVPICRKLFFEHVQRLAKVAEPILTEQGMPVVGDARYRFDSIGCDPHFAHANLYCDVAMRRAIKNARRGRSASSIWYDDREEDTAAKSENPLAIPLPDVPDLKVAAIDLSQIPPTQAFCVGCEKVYNFNDTRAVGPDSRHCLNCMGDVKVVTPIVKKKKRNRRRERRYAQYGVNITEE